MRRNPFETDQQLVAIFDNPPEDIHLSKEKHSLGTYGRDFICRDKVAALGASTGNRTPAAHPLAGIVLPKPSWLS